MGTKLSTHFSSINSAASRTAQYSTFYISHTHKGGSEQGGQGEWKGRKEEKRISLELLEHDWDTIIVSCKL